MRRPPRPKPDSNAPIVHNYMTPSCYQRISDEIDSLWKVQRPKVVDEVHQAALQGDRSENAEYIYGKKKLREIDSRVRYLSKKLEFAKVIDPARQTGVTIQFGATVEVETEDGKVKVYHIVGADEAAPEKRLISNLSPIGRALINKKVDDYVEIETPNGIIALTVVSFEYKAIPHL